MKIVTIHIHFLKSLVELAVSQGVEIDQYLSTFGFNPDVLNKPDARVHLRKFIKLSIAVSAKMHGLVIGYGKNQSYRPSIMLHSMVSSKTLEEALTHYCDFHNNFHPILDVNLVHKKNHIEYNIKLKSSMSALVVSPYTYEMQKWFLYNISCWLLQNEISSAKVSFPFPKPYYYREYKHLFSNSSIRFNSESCSLAIPRDFLNLPVQTEKADVGRLIANEWLELYIPRYANKQWSYKTETLIKAFSPSQQPSISVVSGKLALHPQSLRRRLEKEGETFAKLRNKVKLEKAIQLLKDPNKISIDEIASRLGYSESSTFIRAFKKNEGITPSVYRREFTSWPKTFDS